MTTSKSLTTSLAAFDPDRSALPALALRVEVAENDSEQPIHTHRKGQLVLALRGGVTCEVPNAMWMVPPQCAVWIPGGTPHSNHVTANARICFLFVEPGATELPAETCTLSISPLVRELIEHLADHDDQQYALDSPTARLVGVLLEALATMPVERLHLPISDHPKMRRMVDAWVLDPSDRTTIDEWASRLAMSSRSLARLVQKETGLTFGRWRQQLHLIVALRQLAEGRSVQEVAGNLGYDSVTAFITMFRKALGQPPARYFSNLR